MYYCRVVYVGVGKKKTNNFVELYHIVPDISLVELYSIAVKYEH